jgi:hypothetical protein
MIGEGLIFTGEIIAILETLGGSILLMAPTIVTIYMSGNVYTQIHGSSNIV